MSQSFFNWRTSFWLLFSTVMLPALLCLTVGILILAFYRAAWDVAFGVLVLCFSFFSVSGALITTFLLRRTASLAHLEAEFLANMSHDLRTPLTSIRLFVETLRAGKVQDPEEKRRCLDLLAQETQRMEELVQRVLTFRKIERGVPSQPSRTSIQELIKAAVAPFLLDPQQSARLKQEIAPELPPIDADAEALTDAIRNLISNALKYSGSGEVKICAARDGDRCLLSVSDEGLPIPAVERKKIFKRFYRIKGTRQPGSGLGLALAKHVFENHGGRLRLICGSIKGNIFSVRLPLLEASATDQASGSEERGS